ncbi:MAG: DUF4142 domain-containing protein [Dongiaceae bacterium]
MRFPLAATTIVVTAFLLPGLASGQEATGPGSVQTLPTPLQQSDMEFVTNAVAAGHAEVELGKLATETARDAAVKQFGQRMVDDHTKAGDELAQIARQKNVEVSGELPPDANAAKDRLSGLSGSDFDREYMTMMVADHEKAVDLFTKYSEGGQDADFKQFAGKTLPTLREHLEEARRVRSFLQEVAAGEQTPEEQMEPAAGTPPTPEAATPEIVAPEDAEQAEGQTIEGMTPTAGTGTAEDASQQPTTTQQAARPAYPLGEKTAADLIGQTVVNQNGEEVGSIADIVLNSNDRAVYAILSVGGFLGIGDKSVAVPFGELKPGENETILLMSSATEEDLKARPAYEEGVEGYAPAPRDRPLGESSTE